MEPNETRQRVRLTYEKGEAIKFISHQDEFRLWERTLRRADLPLLYKQGFNPQPHMHFTSPLGVGITGVREFIDVVFAPPAPLDELAARIRAKLPPGVIVHAIEEVEIKEDSLANYLIGADYMIILYAAPGEIEADELEKRIAAFLATPQIWRERERKGNRYTYNLRPLVLDLRYVGYDAGREEHHIFLRVQQRPGATGRPDEVVSAMNLDDFPRTLRRDRLYFSRVAEDAAIFAIYPVVEQAEISAPGVQLPASERQASTHRRLEGRTIGERAGDEFE
jgi:radical SAM-linked protein